jgi:hypothetical protein
MPFVLRPQLLDGRLALLDARQLRQDALTRKKKTMKLSACASS